MGETPPNFGADPTISAAAAGRWSSPGTWLPARLPAAGDVVCVPAGVVVEYDVLSDERINTVAVQAGGHLYFSPVVSTRLVVDQLLPLPGSRLELGTPALPVQPGVTAELVFPGGPLDPAADPDQQGRGLLGYGAVTLHGAPKSYGHRLACEAAVGDTALTLDRAPSGWRQGDWLLIAPTDDLVADWNPGGVLEWGQVESVAGAAVTLAWPLAHAHKGARDAAGALTPGSLPDVMNFTRNLVLRSAEPAGVRGHVQMFDRADVDVRFAEFQSVGRTTDAALGPANHIARYALHLHHVLGAPNPANAGYQFRLEGNSIFDCAKWGIVIHASCYGLVRGNVVAAAQHAGVVTEDGSEAFNEVTDNVVCRVDPTEGHDPAVDPAWTGGYWLQGLAHNVFRRNRAYACRSAYYFPPNLNPGLTFAVPKFRGVAPTTPETAVTVSWAYDSWAAFEDNEDSACQFGPYFDHRHGNDAGRNTPGPTGGVLVKNHRSWHGWGNGSWGVGIYVYDTGGVTVDGLVARRSGVNVSADRALFRLVDSDVQGAGAGFWDQKQQGDFSIEDCVLGNSVDVECTLAASAGDGSDLPDPIKKGVVRDCARPDGSPALVRLTTTWAGEISVVPVLRNVFEAHGQRLYFDAQAPTAVCPDEATPPLSTYKEQGFFVCACPVAGRTNQQALSEHGVCFSGALTPPSATARPWLLGGKAVALRRLGIDKGTGRQGDKE